MEEEAEMLIVEPQIVGFGSSDREKEAINAGCRAKTFWASVRG